ncbi:recombinase family protein [Bradyrhizobium ottawaense]|nr:recombinase family protein [Bradyrhizobium ottawaense]MBR1326071.1 recombinase family protein [Bradyrhizobium ottawaense]
MQEKAEQGIWPSSAAIGYRNVVGPDGRKTIEPDPVLGPIVAQLFGWYAAGGVSLEELTVKARGAGLVNRLSGSTVGKSRIHHILRNRVYSGDFVWKERVYKGKHTPLVSHELGARVQEMLDDRNASKVRGSKREFAFTGLIKCGHCGCALVAAAG